MQIKLSTRGTFFLLNCLLWPAGAPWKQPEFNLAHPKMNIKSQNIFIISIIFVIFKLTPLNCLKVDCFMCSQNMPVCPSCDEGEICYTTKRTCYQCSRAVCAKESYRHKKKHCKSKKKPKCLCPRDKTCLITVRNRISCSQAICIDLIDRNVNYLKDYSTE